MTERDSELLASTKQVVANTRAELEYTKTLLAASERLASKTQAKRELAEQVNDEAIKALEKIMEEIIFSEREASHLRRVIGILQKRKLR